jgi:hypothetical protein
MESLSFDGRCGSSAAGALALSEFELVVAAVKS